MVPGPERIFFPQTFGLGRGGVVAPFQFITTDDDNLRIVSVNAQADVIVTLQGYRLDPSGVKVPFSYVHTPNTDRTAKTEGYKFGAGALLTLNAQAIAGAPVIGQTFVIVQLIRGTGAVAIVLGTLLQGYVTTTQGLGWPGSPIVSSIEGPGYPRTIIGTTPAAGTPINEAVPTGARWLLHSVHTRLTCAGAGANRFANLSLPGAGLETVRLLQLAQSNVGTVVDYYWSIGLWNDTLTVGFECAQGLPAETVLSAGQGFAVIVLNMQAGDQLSAPVFSVREWLEVN